MTSKVLTVEFTFLGKETKVTAEGDITLAKNLDTLMFRHFNKDSVILPKERSDSLYEWYKSHGFLKTKRGDKKTMFYIVEN